MEEFIIHSQQTRNGEVLFIREDDAFDIWRYYSWLDTTVYLSGNNEPLTFKGFVPLEKLLKMKAFL